MSTAAQSSLESLDAQQLRQLVSSLLGELQSKDQQLKHTQAINDKITHELAVLKRLKFAAKSEQFNAQQRSLLQEEIEADIAAVEHELQTLQPPAAKEVAKGQPKRLRLPAQLPRKEVHHEPHNTQCDCGCQMQRIGQDIAEKLHYEPGVFTVERHIRGKWACKQCQTITQIPVPAHVIDKGIPTTGLLAHVLVSKYADHQPLHRLSQIMARSGVAIATSTLAQWVGVCGVQLQPLVDALKRHLLGCAVLHADETPVQMLKPGKGSTHRAYLWAYAPASSQGLQAVIYDFCESRSGEHARRFLGNWQGALVCDDFAGYKASFALGVTEVGCLAHARRKFFDLHQANQSQLAHYVLEQLSKVYDIERQAKELNTQQRLQLRQTHSKPILDALHQWMQLQRQKLPDSSATAKALDYSLRRWDALTRFTSDGQLPVDNNRIENLIRPIAVGRNNWLFAGSPRAGQRSAAIMSLIQSAKLNGHDPMAYLCDVLTRLPTHKHSCIDELLPHVWQPCADITV